MKKIEFSVTGKIIINLRDDEDPQKFIDNNDLVGDVYWYMTDKYLGDGEWDENVDSCGGFYSRKWGEELATEMLGKLITEEEAMSLCMVYDEKLAKEREDEELENWLGIVSAVVA